MAECLFIKADEVIKMLGASQSEAYRIIKKLNEEMIAKGYITILGGATTCAPSALTSTLGARSFPPRTIIL